MRLATMFFASGLLLLVSGTLLIDCSFRTQAEMQKRGGSFKWSRTIEIETNLPVLRLP